MSQYKSILNRVGDIGVQTEEFTPDGETESITYYRLAILVMISGSEEVLYVKLPNEKRQLLLAAKVLDKGDFLDDEKSEEKK